MMTNVAAGGAAHAIGQMGTVVTGPPERAQIPMASTLPGAPMSVPASVAAVDGIPTSIGGQQLVGQAVSMGRPAVSVGVPVRTMAPVVGTLADPRIAPGVTSTVLTTNMSPRPDAGQYDLIIR